MIALDDKTIMSTKNKSGNKDISKYQNKVFNDDILNILKKLPDSSIDLVYSEPDYNVGIRYHGKNYTTEFDEYMNWYVDLIKESMRVLKEDGNLMTMNYSKPNSFLRVNYLQEVAHAVHDYAWVYNTNVGQNNRYFTLAHRSILHATKSKNNKFYKENVYEEYQNPGPVRQKKFRKIAIRNLSNYEYLKRHNEKPDTKVLNEFIKVEGQKLWEEVNKGHIDDLKLTKAKKKIIEESWKQTDEELKGKGRMPYSWINEPLVKNVSDEKTIHPCQIPKKVSSKLILSCTQPGDTVLVLFGGSGSELEVCKENGRNYISAELHETYFDLITKRLKTGKIPDEYRHHTRKS